MTGKRIGYIRVSTADQNPERQLEGLTIDKRFIEHASGGSLTRPQLELMIDYVREDDIIFVHSMDRLARNVKHLRAIIDDITVKGATIQFVKENLTFSKNKSPTADLTLMIMGAVAEFELARIHERIMEGVKIAKRQGKYKGRKRALTDEQAMKMKEKVDTTRDSKTKIAKQFGINRVTLYQYLKKIEQQQLEKVR